LIRCLGQFLKSLGDAVRKKGEPLLDKMAISIRDFGFDAGTIVRVNNGSVSNSENRVRWSDRR
jgi:hypothetical protein